MQSNEGVHMSPEAMYQPMDEIEPHPLGHPLSPAEIREYKGEELMPPVIFEVVNTLLADKIGRGGRIVIKQKDILHQLEERGMDPSEVWARGYLDFEPYYQASGWNVRYDKPGYNESYDAHFVFMPIGPRN